MFVFICVPWGLCRRCCALQEQYNIIIITIYNLNASPRWENTRSNVQVLMEIKKKKNPTMILEMW